MIEKIKAFAFDVDGVMTDGGILCDLEGQLYRTFDAKDGFAVRMATMNGYPVAVITGGRSGSIKQRFASCGIPEEDVYLGSRDKMADFKDFCRRHGITADEVMYFGDDVPDIDVMRSCGCGVCPCDAADDVKAMADLVAVRPGGKGCIREVFEQVMKAQGRWKFDVQDYKRKF